MKRKSYVLVVLIGDLGRGKSNFIGRRKFNKKW
jgi:predicted kinase